MLHSMERNDLPIVVIMTCWGNQRRYLGRLATKEEFKEYRQNSGCRPEDLSYQDWSKVPRR